MATQSKEADAARAKADAKALIGMLGPCVFLVVTGGQLLNQSRPALVLDICNGNQTQAAGILAQLGGMGGAAEFLFNPLMYDFRVHFMLFCYLCLLTQWPAFG